MYGGPIFESVARLSWVQKYFELYKTFLLLIYLFFIVKIPHLKKGFFFHNNVSMS